MKYIYYIIAIVIVFSALAAYGLFDTRIEISKPFISVNDRIISEDEFKKMLDRKPSYMGQEQFIESVIAKQLLIQEAIKMKINTEENFRQSVETFYEQSLIKILLDRKLDSIVVDVTSDEIGKYETFLQNKFVLTKWIYPSIKDAENKTNETIEKVISEFIDLSDDVKFVLLNLKKGELSRPVATDFGVLVYRIDDIKKMQTSGRKQGFDIKRVSLFLEDKKKEQVLNEWADTLRENSEIWRKNE